MNGLSARDKKLLLFFLGIALLVLCYNRIFVPTKDSNEALRTEITQLEKEKAELDEMYAQMDVYLAQQKEMEGEIKEIVSHYPIEMRPEDAVEYAKKIDEENKINFNTLHIAETANLVATLGENNLYSYPITYQFTANYEDIKAMIDRIQKDDNKRNVTDLTLTYNEDEGNLTGTMNVNLFFLDNTGKKYKEPQTSGGSVGKENLFDSK